MAKVIVITGGTSGIGRDLVKKFSKKDNLIFVLSKSKKNIEISKKEINSNNVVFIRCDLLKEDEIIKSFKYIKSRTNHIDLLINNAAYDYMSSIEEYEYEIFSKIINTNLLGKVFCLKNAIKLLKESNYPCVINIASRLATKPMNDSSAYCSTAAAIVMFTKCAALELERYSIRVNCISPSLTITPLSLKSYTQEEIECVKNISTRKRLCTSNDIYELIVFLSSKKSDYINGENVNLSSGILLK